jgi:hypothetical protein
VAISPVALPAVVKIRNLKAKIFKQDAHPQQHQHKDNNKYY